MWNNKKLASTCIGSMLIVALLGLTGCGGVRPEDAVVVKSPQPLVVEPPTLSSVLPSPADTPAAIHWGFQKDAITLDVFTKGKLNEYNGQPHTLMICLYQLSARKGFTEYSNSVVGIEKLLTCKNFGSDVTSTKRIFIQPDGNQKIVLDRDEGTKYLGVVAGYYDIVPGLVTRIYEFPISVNKSGMLWWKKSKYSPAKFKTGILLSPNSMQTVGGK
ncbi:type VI secretion system lipoprotein TssJ [Halodesulfovibrio sp. MK-HDV]|jgi:type VI secretion system VasD/TssJ family lipoprotein|uniref:type VI secretion system lipoprotein TssJ n=1 Tax=Halodesulfovibrio sp. MK-HDV TaxID=2599925 RepID=UPI00136EDC80|nr:type VI secretion system lipoprotein TssJ [Halodesulfovibrio sp. MK-HDV]KAF1077355.1 hypothetical protein MKHDV_00419 [Halodesulfovibrio sp. MK-HDV]